MVLTHECRALRKAPPRMSEDAPIDLLASGIEAFNSWREEHPEATVDLMAADLSARDLRGANFAGAKLTRADLSGSDLTGACLDDTSAKLGVWEVQVTQGVVHVRTSGLWTEA